jgi:hypothetical protein
MGDKAVIMPLYENGDWLEHELPREVAKPAVRDMIKQMSDEPPGWLFIGLSRHQLAEFVEAALAEMREREHAPIQPPVAQNGLRLLGES